jgi:gamma-glutamyltranspeptidase/glutathione hydrolase
MYRLLPTRRAGGWSRAWTSPARPLHESTVAALQGFGHSITLEAPDAAFGFGDAQLVHRLESGAYAAGSDPRKDGQAVGF